MFKMRQTDRTEEAKNPKWTETLKPHLLGEVFKAIHALKLGESGFQWSLPFMRCVKQEILLRLDLSEKVS